MKKPARRSATVLAHLLPALCAASAGCGPAQPEVPPQPAVPAPPPKPGPRPALKLPSRALPAGRAVTFVTRIGDKALYTVNGERWLVDGQGKVEREREPFGTKLDGVMPYSRGGATALGWTSNKVFTFSDILATPRLLAESDGTLVHVRQGPNAVLLFGYFAAAAIDPVAGAEKTGIFPEFPVKDAIFLDDKRGVAHTVVGGIGTTADGGHTWKPLKHKVTASVPTILHSDGTSIYLREGYGSRAAKVDVSQSTLGDTQDIPAPKTPAPTAIETWLTANGNPISSAVRNGIDGGKETGVVAGSGALARVDLGSGAFTETARYDGGSGECRGATSGKEAYLVCSTLGKRSGSQLWQVKTAGKLEMEAVKGATFGGVAAADLMGTPGGGLLVLQGCGERSGGMCVRQPDGSFTQVDAAMVAYPSTMGPLVDGRVVSVGIRKNADGKSGGQLLEVVASTARERKVLEELAFEKDTSVSVTRPEEGADGEVRFLVNETKKGKTEVYLYSYEPGKKGFDKTLVPDAVQAAFADGVLIARGKGDAPFRVSHDHGMTFRDLDMPKGTAATFTAVNRLGTVSTSHVRVGWEPLSEPVEAPKLTAAYRLKSPPVPPRPSTDLACKTSGTGKTGSVLAKHDSEIASVFDVKPAPKGTRRATAQLVSSALDPVVHFSIEAKEPPAGSPPGTKVRADRWVMRWIDPREVDAKPKSVSGKAPYDDMYSYVRAAWARDGRLLASLSIAGKNVLLRTKGAGFETVEVASALVPTQGGAQSFSSDGSLIAYLAGEVLVVWKSGEVPRPVSMVNQRYSVLLGAPGKDGIAVLAVADSQSYYRVFPLPASKSAEPLEQQWISAEWDGWSKGPSVFSKGAIPFCDAKASGTLFRSTMNGPSLSARIGVDGASPKSFRTYRYDIQSDGQSLCLEAMAAELWERASVSVKSGTSTKQVSLDFIRLANKGKKADITVLGKPLDKVPVHALSCEPTPK